MICRLIKPANFYALRTLYNDKNALSSEKELFLKSFKFLYTDRFKHWRHLMYVKSLQNERYGVFIKSADRHRCKRLVVRIPLATGSCEELIEWLFNRFHEND